MFLAHNCNLAIAGIIVDGNNYPLKLLINCKNIQSKAFCGIGTEEPNLSLVEIETGWIREEHEMAQDH